MPITSNSTFRTLDSAGAAQAQPIDAHAQRELARNMNHLVQDLVQPCVTRAFDAADGTPDGLLYRHSYALNAPPGAWTSLLPPTVVALPAGCEQLEVDVVLTSSASMTAYLYPWSLAQPFDAGAATSDSRVWSASVTTTPTTFPSSVGTWRFPVRADGSGRAVIGIALSTSAATVRAVENLYSHDVGARRLWSAANLGTYNFDSLRDYDTWVRVLGAGAFIRAWRYDDSAGTYTELTSLGSSASNELVWPAGFAVGDAFYYGAAAPFPGRRSRLGVQGVGTWTMAREYWNGSAWTAVTHLGSGQEISTWREATTSDLYDLWDPPTDWAPLALSTNETLFYMRDRVTAVTAITTEPEVDTCVPLPHHRLPWTRVLAGGSIALTGDTIYQLDYAPPRWSAPGGIGSDEVAVVARGGQLVVGALLLEPVAIPLRAE